MDASAPIAELGLSVRVVNMLEEAGIETIRDLVTSPPARMLRVPGLGVIGLRECQRAVDRWLKGEPVEEPELPRVPTNARPGSAAKIEALRERSCRGESLHHPDDETLLTSLNIGDGGVRQANRRRTRHAKGVA